MAERFDTIITFIRPLKACQAWAREERGQSGKHYNAWKLNIYFWRSGSLDYR